MTTVHKIQTVILGEATAGKTSIVSRLVKNSFTENTCSTIGAAFMVGKFDDLRYDFWDTAGQERYLSLMPMYYRKGDILLLVFDASRLSTIDRLIYYLDKIRNDMVSPYEIILIGNKLDLAKNSTSHINQILEEKFEDFNDIFKNEINCIYVSSKTGDNFDKLILKLKEKGKIMENIKFKDQEEDNKIVTIQSDTASIGIVNKVTCGYC